MPADTFTNLFQFKYGGIMEDHPDDKTLLLVSDSGIEGIKWNDEAEMLISGIRQPTCVIGIIGPNQSGKSFLLNKISGQRNAFQVGRSESAKYCGLCIRYFPYLQWLVLDTQGTSNMEDDNHIWLTALVLMLSSVVIYNTVDVITQPDLDELHRAIQTVDNIRKSLKSVSPAAVKQSSQCHLVWAMRNIDKLMTVTPDQYLHNILSGDNHLSEQARLGRDTINRYFVTEKCFVFPTPTDKLHILNDLEEAQDSDIIPGFMASIFGLKQHILSMKALDKVPTELCELGKMYVEEILSGVVPKAETKMHQAAVLMTHMKRLQPQEILPQLSEKNWNDLQQQLDQDVSDQEEDMEEFKIFLDDLNQPIQNKVNSGYYYTTQNGCGEYDLDVDRLIVDFRNRTAGKPQAETALAAFLQQKESERMTIQLVIDKTLAARTNAQESGQSEVGHSSTSTHETIPVKRGSTFCGSVEQYGSINKKWDPLESSDFNSSVNSSQPKLAPQLSRQSGHVKDLSPIEEDKEEVKKSRQTGLFCCLKSAE